MKVVHCKKAKFDVYIGRNPDPIKGKFGNPFSHKAATKAEVTVPTIKQAMEYFERWLREGAFFLQEIGLNPSTELYNILINKRNIIMSSLPELKGKTLGCWCKFKGDEDCHGDILLTLVEEEFPNT